jgi:hypothetical protein
MTIRAMRIWRDPKARTRNLTPSLRYPTLAGTPSLQRETSLVSMSRTFHARAV